MTKNFSQKYLDSLLNYGADDYIRVPFSNNDLYSKFLSIYRNGILKPRTIYRYKDIIMDTTSQIVYLDDDVVDLTNNEYKLLFNRLPIIKSKVMGLVGPHYFFQIYI